MTCSLHMPAWILGRCSACLKIPVTMLKFKWHTHMIPRMYPWHIQWHAWCSMMFGNVVMTYPTIKKIRPVSSAERLWSFNIARPRFRQLEWNVRTGHVSHRFHPPHSFPKKAQVTPEDYELHKSQIRISWRKKHGGRMQRKGDHPGWS